jgi:hypothetical protein
LERAVAENTVEGGSGMEPAGTAEEALTLSLEMLLPDAGGEIVLFNESGALSIAIVTGQRVVGEGSANPHVTASGLDVSGWAFCRFETGTILYYPSDVHLSITDQV